MSDFSLIEVLDELWALTGAQGAALRRAAATNGIGNREDRTATPAEVELFSTRLDMHLRALIERLASRPRSVEAENYMFWMDDVALKYLARLGPFGSEVLERFSRGSVEAWAKYVYDGDAVPLFGLWSDDGRGYLLILELIVETVWEDVVKPELARVKYPALSLAVVGHLNAGLWRKKRRIVKRHDQLVLVDAEGAVVAKVLPTRSTEVPADLEDTLSATRSLVIHRLLRWLLAEVFRQTTNPNIRNPRLVMIDGGFVGLASRLGLRGDKASATLRAALDILQVLVFPMPDGGEGPLLTWKADQKASPRGRARLVIKMADAWLPTYVSPLADTTLTQRDAKRIVPMRLSGAWRRGSPPPGSCRRSSSRASPSTAHSKGG